MVSVRALGRWWGGVEALLVATTMLSLASCQVRGAQTGQSPILKFLQRASGLIAYIAPDGNVNIIDQKGGRKRALTADAGANGSGEGVLYAFPTWSPDRSLLAYVRLTGSGQGSPVECSLVVAAPDGSTQTRLFTGTRLQPFYLFWAPDSRKISVLSSVQGEQQLELGVATVRPDPGYSALDRGSPYYWDWLGGGASIISHVNIGMAGSAEERLSLVSLSQQSARTDLPFTAGAFQAPAVSPDGKTIAYVVGDPQKFEIHLRSVDGASDRTVASGSGAVYLSYAPDGKRIAYLSAESTAPVPQGTLHVLDLPDAKVDRAVAESPVISFFWAPNSRLIAFVEPGDPGNLDTQFQQGQRQIVLKIAGCDPQTGKTWTIAQFPTSRGFLNLLPFFDQYQRSATLWSPDSRHLVFTALSAEGGPGLFIASADGNLKPVRLVAGDSAFWSWR